MSIAVVWSSANTDGLTASAKDAFIEGIRENGTDVEEIYLNGLKLEHCRACGNGWGACRAKGVCIIKDDFEETYKKLAEADGIVWITAVYWHDTTEVMKAFVDRLRRCETAHASWLPVQEEPGLGLWNVFTIWRKHSSIWECGLTTVFR